MARIVLASSNRGKLKEFKSILKLPDTDLIAQSEFGVVDAEETGCTFVENALIKARHATSETGLPSIADDSGLEVDALMVSLVYSQHALLELKVGAVMLRII